MTPVLARPTRNLILTGILGLAVLGGAVPALSASPYGSTAERSATIAPMLAEITPAVVNISVASFDTAPTIPFMEDPFLKRFFDIPEMMPHQKRALNAGSGVIVDAEKGYVLTNNHVIESGGDITVTLTDRRSFQARVIGGDPATDIALLQIDADGLTAVELGDSDTLRVGDFVIAIGNPFGLGQTVTSGIVSALGRNGLIPEGYEDFIQTDASINPGNSGGALVTFDGHLVGINTAILSPNGSGNVGIGFSVPSNMARSIMDQLIEHGEVRRGRLGVIVQDLTPDLAEALDIEAEQGALIAQVQPGTPAEKAGLAPGDLVLTLDGLPVESSSDLRNRIGLKLPGSRVDLGILRKGQALSRTLVLTAADAPSAGPMRETPSEIGRIEGAHLRPLQPGDPLFGQAEGIFVASVDLFSQAERTGLEPGDLIVAVGRTPVTTTSELRTALAETEAPVALSIQRGGARLFLVLRP